MKLYLYRTHDRHQMTDGVIRNEDGVRICDTAEYSPDMMAPGTYKVTLPLHPRFDHRSPMVGHSAFIIHGNGVHAKGFGASIIVGEHLVHGVVIHSYRYFRRLVKRIEKAHKRGREVEIVINS